MLSPLKLGSRLPGSTSTQATLLARVRVVRAAESRTRNSVASSAKAACVRSLTHRSKPLVSLLFSAPGVNQ